MRTEPEFEPNTDPVSGWTPPAMPAREAMEGRYVRLEPLSAEAHGADLHAAFAADETGANWTYRLQEPFESEEALHGWLRDLERADGMLYFAFIDRDSGRALGNGALMTITPETGLIEVGSIMFSPALQSSRAGTEAIFLLMAHAFALGYRRFEWTCDSLNTASVAAAHRFGFTYEATHRAAVISKRRERSTAIFSIILEDWHGIRDAFEAWLDPANFDANGIQQTRLSERTAPFLHARFPGDTSTRRNALGQMIGAAAEDWTPAPAPPNTAMQGRYCRVEPLDGARHAADLFAANTSAENWDWLPYGPFETLETYREWIDDACASQDPLFFAIIGVETGRAVGVASYLRINPAHGLIEVGHINFAPAMQRTPMATEAMFLMMQRAFELGYRRYEWKCNAANAGSRAAALRLGFVYEGMTRSQTMSKGCNRDTAWFAIAEKDWPTIHTGFERWLAPDNFDDAGRQRRSLAETRLR